jgi:hypothetical protein
LKAIQVDPFARKLFHPKHAKNSQALKNVAEHVIKCVQRVAADGIPDWYINSLSNDDA